MPTWLKTFLTAVVLAAAIVAVALLCNGCVYKGAKVVEGTDMSVGLNVPSTDGAFQFQLLNYLSGFRLGVAENARMTMKYSVSETNSYLGCITTRTYKSVDAVVEPCEDDKDNSTTPDDGGGSTTNTTASASVIVSD